MYMYMYIYILMTFICFMIFIHKVMTKVFILEHNPKYSCELSKLTNNLEWRGVKASF